MKNMFAGLLAFIIPLCGLQAGITGTYSVVGGGSAEISKEDAVYVIHWDVPAGLYSGRGVKKEDFVAFYFENDENIDDRGVILYKIKCDRLVDEYVTFDGTEVFNETLIKDDSH